MADIYDMNCPNCGGKVEFAIVKPKMSIPRRGSGIVSAACSNCDIKDSLEVLPWFPNMTSGKMLRRFMPRLRGMVKSW